MNKRHAHIRPAFEKDSLPPNHNYAIDCYNGRNQWDSTGYYPTKQEAQKAMRKYNRKERNLSKKRKTP